jgi:hypothetical protein
MKIQYLFIILVCLTACNNNKKLLCKKWQAVKLYNPKMEALIAQTKADIDTIGNEDAIIGKATNVDSFRNLMKEEMEKSIQELDASMKNTTYQFFENGVSYLSTADGVDSAKWTLEADSMLRIDEPALTGMGDVQLFKILKLDANNLQLQMIIFADTSTMSFVPAK